MKATIYLNDETTVEVNNFQTIKDDRGSSLSKEQLQSFVVSLNRSYTIIGDLTVSVMGEKIKYIEFDPKD